MPNSEVMPQKPMQPPSSPSPALVAAGPVSPLPAGPVMAGYVSPSPILDGSVSPQPLPAPVMAGPVTLPPPPAPVMAGYVSPPQPAPVIAGYVTPSLPTAPILDVSVSPLPLPALVMAGPVTLPPPPVTASYVSPPQPAPVTASYVSPLPPAPVMASSVSPPPLPTPFIAGSGSQSPPPAPDMAGTGVAFPRPTAQHQPTTSRQSLKISDSPNHKRGAKKCEIDDCPCDFCDQQESRIEILQQQIKCLQVEKESQDQILNMKLAHYERLKDVLRSRVNPDLYGVLSDYIENGSSQIPDSLLFMCYLPTDY